MISEKLTWKEKLSGITYFVLFLSIIFLISFAFVKMVYAQNEIYSFDEKNDFKTTWMLNKASSNHIVYDVIIQNLDASTNRDFPLAILLQNFEDLNIEEVTIYEKKIMPVTLTNSNVSCEEQFFENGSSYDFCIENPYDYEVNMVQWKPAKNNFDKLQNGALYNEYGYINIPKYNSKPKFDDFGDFETNNGEKYFRVELKGFTPILYQAELGVQNFVTQDFYHPIINSSFWNVSFDTDNASDENLTIHSTSIISDYAQIFADEFTTEPSLNGWTIPNGAWSIQTSTYAKSGGGTYNTMYRTISQSDNWKLIINFKQSTQGMFASYGQDVAVASYQWVAKGYGARFSPSTPDISAIEVTDADGGGGQVDMTSTSTELTCDTDYCTFELIKDGTDFTLNYDGSELLTGTDTNYTNNFDILNIHAYGTTLYVDYVYVYDLDTLLSGLYVSDLVYTGSDKNAFIMNYVCDGSCNVSFEYDGEVFELIESGAQYNLSGLPSSNTTANFSVIFNGNFSDASVYFLSTILPASPEVFNLTSPNNTQYELGDTITFNWEASFDNDTSSLNYTIYVYNDTALSFTNTTINETSISKVFNELNNFTWYVNVTDGLIINTSNQIFTFEVVPITSACTDYSVCIDNVQNCTAGTGNYTTLYKSCNGFATNNFNLIYLFYAIAFILIFLALVIRTASIGVLGGVVGILVSIGLLQIYFYYGMIMVLIFLALMLFFAMKWNE